MKTNAVRQRFTLQEFTNRGGSLAWRVSGVKRDGTRIRDNFADRQSAQCRQIELEGEYLSKQSETTLRATRLSDLQIRLAESTYALLERDEDLMVAVQFWRQQGRKQPGTESPRLDEAVQQFNAWLLTTDSMREHSKRNLRIRLNIFANSVHNAPVSEFTADTIDAFLSKRRVSAATRDNDRRAISRFFSWCLERPRRWAPSNPCREVRVSKPEKPPPCILSVDACERLLKAAVAHKGGMLAPYVAACLFAGLRPFEASRLPWEQVNLTDGEIRLHAHQTKTGQPRTIAFNDGPPEQAPFNAALKAWLAAFKGKPFFPPNWRKEFDAVKLAAEIDTWPEDVMRHTAISHFFRLTGSYGRTAEMFGNSEAIIKQHYQSRTSSAETSKFYSLHPNTKTA